MQFPRSRLELRPTALGPQPAWRQGPNQVPCCIVIGQDDCSAQYREAGRAAGGQDATS